METNKDMIKCNERAANIEIPDEPVQTVPGAEETIPKDEYKDVADSCKDILSDKSGEERESSRYDQQEYEALQSEIDKSKLKDSILKKIVLAAKKAILAPVQIFIIKPVQKIGNAVGLLLMPKASRQKLYDDAIARAKEAIAKEQKEALKEDAATISQKMKIIRNNSLSDVDQIRELARLALDSEKIITVKTKEGALCFEKVGDTVLIKHAIPRQRTAESAMTYSFQTVGGIVFHKSGIAKKDETDIYDAVKQLRMDKGFDQAVRGINEDAIIENSNNYGIVEDTALQTEIRGDVEENIIAGDNRAVEEQILEAIDIEDYQAGDGLDENLSAFDQELSENPPSYDEFVASLQAMSSNKSLQENNRISAGDISYSDMPLPDSRNGLDKEIETYEILFQKEAPQDKAEVSCREPEFPAFAEEKAFFNDTESFDSILADAAAKASEGAGSKQKELEIEREP